MERIQEYGPGIWTADGPRVRCFGIPFPTRMIVVKLGDGSLWVNSPVPADHSELDQLAAIGSVRYLIAPTRLHVWRLQDWAAHFPQAETWGPPRVSGRWRGRFFTHVLGDKAPPAWAAALEQMIFRGSFFLDEVYFLHSESRTLIVGDFIQNYPARSGRFLYNALLKAGGLEGGGVPVDVRLSFLGHKQIGRRSLKQLLAWNFDKMIVAHGDCVDRDAKAFVQRAFAWLR